MQLTEVLLACTRPEPLARREAEGKLQSALQNHTEEYFKLLAEELADDSKPPEARQLAGLQLKNALYGKTKVSNHVAVERWLRQCGDQCKNLVRDRLLKALQSREDVGRKYAALVFGKLAALDIPHNAWPKDWPPLLRCLLDRILNESGEYTDQTRVACLQALGYIAEELAVLSDEGLFKMDESDTSNIFAAITQGMVNNNWLIKVESTKAMFFTILLAEDVFRNEPHRTWLMEIILKACLQQPPAGNPQQDHLMKENQKNSLEILTKIFERYYDHMAQYMEVIGRTMLQLIEAGGEEIDIRAMMVWTQIAEEELEIKEENAYAGREIRRSLNIINDAYPSLVPVLTKKLIDPAQEEDYDSDEYTLKMASQISLKFCAQILGDDIIAPLRTFLTQYLQSADWREKEAAILALGSIMDGPTSGAKMSSILGGCFDYLCDENTLGHRVVAVRDTTAWTIATILKHHITICNVNDLVGKLCFQMENDVPRVCRHICYAFHVIAEQDYQLEPVLFQRVASVLLMKTQDESPAAKEQRLQSSAYNALAIVVKKVREPAKLGNILEKLTEEVTNRLQFAIQNKRSDPQCELHGNLCVCLSELVDKFPREQVLALPALPHAMMKSYIECFELYASLNEDSVLPDTLMAVSMLIKKMEQGFEPYVQPCLKYFETALRNSDDVQTCNMCTSLVGNPLAHHLKLKFMPFSEVLIAPIIENVKKDVDKKIKLSCICTLGDVAMALGGSFVPALPSVIQVLGHAGEIRVSDEDADNVEWLEYVNKLRENVLEAYVSIAFGLQEGQVLDKFKGHVNQATTLIGMVIEDFGRTQQLGHQIVSLEVLRLACALLSDLVEFFQKDMCDFVRNAPYLTTMLNDVPKQTNDEEVMRTLALLQNGLRKYGA